MIKKARTRASCLASAHGARANKPHSRAKPGTWKFTDDFIFQTGSLRTEAFACTCACILQHHVRHAADKPDMMNAEHTTYMQSIPVVLAEGLSRTEPLHFSKDRLSSKQVCKPPSRNRSQLHWVSLQAVVLAKAITAPTLHMAEAGATGPALPDGPSDGPPEGQAEAKPKRYPRSRVRADGARRRTQAEIEARRKAKREGTGYWAGKGGGSSPSKRPPPGPSTARSSSRSNRTDRNWGQAWYSGSAAARSSSRSDRTGQNWVQQNKTSYAESVSNHPGGPERKNPTRALLNCDCRRKESYSDPTSEGNQRGSTRSPKNQPGTPSDCPVRAFFPLSESVHVPSGLRKIQRLRGVRKLRYMYVPNASTALRALAHGSVSRHKRGTNVGPVEAHIDLTAVGSRTERCLDAARASSPGGTRRNHDESGCCASAAAHLARNGGSDRCRTNTGTQGCPAGSGPSANVRHHWRNTARSRAGGPRRERPECKGS